MTLERAIHYLEFPLALYRDFGADAVERARSEQFRLVRRAEHERPLRWQAYEARRAKRPVVGGDAAAEAIVAYRELGGSLPSLPSTPGL